MVINSKQYTMGNLHELPSDIIPSKACEITNGDLIGYFGIHSPLSNFHPATFTIKDCTYTCVEQYIQSDKATFAGDLVANQKIMQTKDPRIMKSIGNKLNNFNQQQWDRDRAREVAYTAIQHKFNQNPHLKKYLKDTDNKILFEASTDTMWGCGLHIKKPRCAVPTKVGE